MHKPVSAMCQKRTFHYLFDHFVGAIEQRTQYVETKRPGSLEIDHEFEFHGLLGGTIRQTGLHFSIDHSDVPNIDPAQDKLVIHGNARQPKEFTLETLSRYPLVTRINFLECAGNRRRCSPKSHCR